jgi:hypothetical protein
MKTQQQQPSKWLQMSDALATLASGYEKIDAIEKSGGFALPSLAGMPVLNGNGHGTNGHSKTNGHAAKALPAPQKVRKAAVKALPAAPTTALAKTPRQVKAEAKAAAKAAAKTAKAEARATKAAEKAAAKAPKAAPKAKAAAKTKGESSSAIAAGRRAVADGVRPKLVDAIAIVMGGETLKAGDILERLTARGWEPGATNKQSYISYTLSDNGDTFQRANRGEYSVKDPKKFLAVATEFKTGKAKAAPKAAAAAPAPKAKAKGKGSKTSGKAEGVASTDAGEVEAVTAPQEAEVAQAPEVIAEAAPVAGDPPISTPDATVSAESAQTDEALADLGIGATEIGENPFEALN